MTPAAKRVVTALCLLYGSVTGAGFLCPYDPVEQFRDHTLAAPSLPSAADVHWFAEGPEYRFAGVIPCRRHLFVIRPGAAFLLGTDAVGRDEWSRLLTGAQLSLYTGLAGAASAMALALSIGLWAGYAGGPWDAILMRSAELFQTVPWLYLLIAVRASMPLRTNPESAFAVMVLLLGAIGWAKPARIIRGVACSARGLGHVEAARGFGASHLYLLRRHVLPHAFGVTFTQAAILIPQFILAEMALSFLGLGVMEPVPTWGNMLTPLRQYRILSYCWWLYAPAATLVPVLLLYQRLADEMQEASKSPDVA